MAWNFIKTQASSVANALTYGLTHLDQVSTAGDIIVVQHPDGTLHSTPFNVRFGIFSVPRPQTKVVQIQVNGQMVSAVMKLRSDGSAYFLESSGRSNSGDFPISPTTGAISPPRSPTLSAASPLTIISNNSNNGNNQTQNTSTNNNNAANITDVKNKNNNSNGNDDAASSALHHEIVTVDEGSAVEIAKNNPEFRDLVTSMLGEGRETALQESFAAAANYNNNNNNNNINQGGGDSFVGRPNGHMRISSSSGAAAAVGGTGSASAVAEIGSGGGGGIIDEGISPVQRQATGQDASWFASGNGSNGVSPPGDSAINLPPGANANNNNNSNSSNAIPHVTFADNNNNHNNSSMSLVTPLAGGGKSFASVSGGLRLSRFASSDNIAALNNLIANDDEFAAIVKEIGQQHEQLQHQQQQPLQLASASLTNDEGASSETLNASNASPSVQENSQLRQNDSTASPTSIALLDQTNNAKFNINKNSTPEIISMGQNAASPDFRHKNSIHHNKVIHEVPAISQQHHQPLQLLPPSQGQQQQHPVPVSLLPPDQAGSQIIDDGDFVDDSSDDDYDYFYQPSSANNNNKVSDATKQGGATSALPQLSLAGAANNNNEGNNIDVENVNNNNLEGTTTEQQEFLQNNSKKLAGGVSQQQQHAHHVHATTTPSHNELVKLGLKDGANIVKFIVYSTTLTRSIEVEARIFLWPYTAKVIISDIDGTVTKSDVMGHLSAILRWDWTHPGLCSLYTNIAKNEYKFLYLTARSLSQTSSTRSFLESIVQDGQRLPDGPVFTAPEKLFAALTQEVFKRSHIFKTNCLTEVRDIFPKSLRHPLYAGFGNRIGDSIAYEGVGIPLHKIFIIDESSVVHVCKVKQTYRDLAHLVDMTFPPISGKIPVHASQLPVPYTDVVVKNGQTYARSDSPVSSNGATAGSVGSFSVNNNNNNQLPISPTLSSSALQSGRGAVPPMTGHFPNTGDGHQGSSDATRSPSSDKNNNYFTTGGQSRTNSNNNGLGITTTIGGSGNPVAPPLFVQSSNSNNNKSNKGSDEMMEEKVDFNEFNYWRVDPSSLVSLNRANSSAKTTSAGTSTVPSVLSYNNNSATSSNSAVTSPSRPTNSSTAKGGSSLLSDAPSSINNAATTPRSDNSASQPSNHDGSQQQQQQPVAATSAGWFGSWFGRGNKTAPPPPLPPAGATATTEQQQHQSEESSQQVPALEKKPSLLSDK